MPKDVSVLATNLLLQSVASPLPPGTHATMLTDSAGWHAAKDLRMQPNTTLLHLPPRSPERNAIGRVWRRLRDRHLPGRPFACARAIVEPAATS